MPTYRISDRDIREILEPMNSAMTKWKGEEGKEERRRLRERREGKESGVNEGRVFASCAENFYSDQPC